ncbi:MAG: hypothetical protein J4F35_15580 [Candidatus Latescibacteria bacterium]|nr:hypothetical protein [Candidatus Latescibacterota bacterium]
MFAQLNRLMALLALCGAVEADNGIEDADPIEINPLEYIPLEVGNGWTYEHSYYSWPKNETKIVAIEITHTEVIDGLAYFVFSGPDYDWPPLPDFFWGGKKVRLFDERFLVFRWNGQDRPVYDFGHLGTPYEYIGTLPSEFDAAKEAGFSVEGPIEVHFNRFYAQYRLSKVIFSFFYEDIIDSWFPLEGRIHFLQGYGMGNIYNERRGFEGITTYWNALTPVSATISGEELVYAQVRSFHKPHFESTGVGQVGQVRLDEGFDFSAGKHSEPSNDFKLVLGDPSASFVTIDGFFSDVPHLYSKTGVAHLGEIDFGLLISKGVPPDLQLDALTAVSLTEGHTYAIRSREGGIVLLYVFDVEFYPSPEHIKFDWVYYPSGMPDTDTSVQPISWGQLKNSLLRRK